MIGITVSRTRRAFAVAVALVAATTALTACASTASTTASTPASMSAADSHNDVDVEFATQMIPHHQQALDMVAMTEGRDLSPEFAELTQAMKAAQTDEIGLMASWLDSWGVDPATAESDHMAMMHDDSMGMMTEDDLAALRDSAPAGFESMWLTMMIQHHEGAITMAQDQLANGMDADARALATGIVSAQQDEIAQMKAMIAAG